MKENELKNHQLLEVCGIEIFRKIQRKQIIEDAKDESEQVVEANSSENNR